MNRRQLPLRDRSPFARRVLIYLRAQDPPMAVAEIARRVGVSRQAFNKWMYGAVPEPDKVIELAYVIGCTVEELQLDIEASKGWQPPISFLVFYQLVEQTAQVEQWSDKESILPWLRLAVAWQDADTFSANFARDVLVQKIPLHTKAARLARIVQAARELGNG